MFIFAPANRKGEVLEWLKRRVWKARDLPKGFAGSNPALSAESRGCHQPRVFASTAGSPFLFFSRARNLIHQLCLCVDGGPKSSPPQRSAPVPTTPAACPVLHRRIPDIFSVLLRAGKPPPSVFRPAQEDPRHLFSPPTRRETTPKRVSALTGGMSAPLHSSCADGNHSQACSDSHRRTPDIFSVLLRTVLLLRKRGEWNPAVPVSDSR